MTIQEQIEQALSMERNLTPLRCVQIIQQKSGISLERAINGYYHYKSSYRFQDQKAHEEIINSKAIKLLHWIDPFITKVEF